MSPRNIHDFVLYHHTKLLKRKASPLQIKRPHHLIPDHDDGIDQEHHKAGDDGREPPHGLDPRQARQDKEEEDEGAPRLRAGPRTPTPAGPPRDRPELRLGQHAVLEEPRGPSSEASVSGFPRTVALHARERDAVGQEPARVLVAEPPLRLPREVDRRRHASPHRPGLPPAGVARLRSEDEGEAEDTCQSILFTIICVPGSRIVHCAQDWYLCLFFRLDSCLVSFG